jgi:hypothetical protein
MEATEGELQIIARRENPIALGPNGPYRPRWEAKLAAKGIGK